MQSPTFTRPPPGQGEGQVYGSLGPQLTPPSSSVLPGNGGPLEKNKCKTGTTLTEKCGLRKVGGKAEQVF